jgi:NitT/TauT family transport system substrate-binding protein
MSAWRGVYLSRRQALRAGGFGLTGAGAALLFGCGDDGDDQRSPTPLGGSPTQVPAPGEEPPPEVTEIRLPRNSVGCVAPLLAAEEFLHEEGFQQVHYQILEPKYSLVTESVLSGRIDMTFNFVPAVLHAIDAGEPLLLLGGAHVACFQIVAGDHVQSLSDMRGRRFAIPEIDPRPSDFAFVTSIMQYIGLNAGRDFEIVSMPNLAFGPPRPLIEGHSDATLLLTPRTAEYRAKGVGHVVLDSMLDEPWRQYFCCLLNTRREFAEQYPVATRRAVRAILKGIDRCAREPDGVAQLLYDKGWILTKDSADQAVREVAFDAWRSQDPSDTIRFHALRLNEAGVIDSTPEEIIERATDFTYFNELKEELAMFAAPREGASAAAFDCEVEAEPGYALRGPGEQTPGGTNGRDI